MTDNRINWYITDAIDADVEIWINGRERTRDCILADERTGKAVVYKRNLDGRLALKDGWLVKETLFANVRVKNMTDEQRELHIVNHPHRYVHKVKTCEEE